jgi:glycosyltransferase involved in cell wall biosynthesis
MIGHRRRVLALSPIPEEGAGCRFRITQFVPFLKSAGYDVTIRPFFSPEFFRLVYRRGRYLTKVAAFGGLTAERVKLLRDLSQYDLIFLYREAYPIGPPLFERWLSGPGKPPIIYDFDDAVFLPNVSDANRFLGSLKWVRKIPEILSRSAAVVAGNDYLASFARRHNASVETIPTCVDTTKFVPRADRTPRDPRRPIVGWIGSPTTAPYLAGVAPALQRVSAARPFTFVVSGAGEEVRVDGVETVNMPWSLDNEVGLFNQCDIGIYPLTDDEWAQGKCGFKAIQFMACGVPVVASAVGVNREIVQDGVNGFLASNDAEWETKLSALIADPQLRARFAEAGRRTVEQRYSLAVNAPKLARVFDRVLGTPSEKAS